ncbi:hypothetical protein DPMN_045131 [Dreissena polymorpha]|uniref:Uncharacterized protein n=1 Tax=Dreissena polymorpha TaxID=45954 RepID=A0A9D4D4A2_DREPO|nr:hypothetical protein DPMN_045131 [Dreissena polymorpha]
MVAKAVAEGVDPVSSQSPTKKRQHQAVPELPHTQPHKPTKHRNATKNPQPIEN